MRLITEWEKTRTSAHLLIALDEDDPELINYSESLLDYECGRGDELDWLHWEVRPRMRLGGTLNYWATTKAAEYAVIGFLGDDHVPRTHGFDARVKSAMDSMGGTGVVYGNDLLQGQALPTAVAISSDVIQALGYMVPPGMVHLWIDNAWAAMGKAMERYSYLPDVIIEHLHPAGGKAEWDERYVEVNAGAVWTADEAAYKAWLEDGTYRAVLRKLVNA
jgi:hypothetical protein